MDPVPAAAPSPPSRFTVAAGSVLAWAAAGDAARTHPDSVAPSVLLLLLKAMVVLALPALLSRRIRPWAIGYLLGTTAIPVLLVLGWVVIATLLSMG